ncbi:MAG TPA: MFS transporter, partial [Telluria sp.]
MLSVVARRDLPMAATTLNIVQRLGGPTLTTLCALALGWLLAAPGELGGLDAWAWAFLLLAVLHALSVVAAACLPARA